MRIIAGKFGRRTLRGPRSLKLRPTSDKLRETLFNILGERIQGAVLLDLYAGTGAVGIEALSRGARLVIFVEKHRPTAQLIRKNLESVGASAGTEIRIEDAASALDRIASQGTRADFVFLDPPYADYDACSNCMQRIESSGILAPGGVVIAEHARKQELPARFGRLVCKRTLEQGDSALSFYSCAYPHTGA